MRKLAASAVVLTVALMAMAQAVTPSTSTSKPTTGPTSAPAPGIVWDGEAASVGGGWVHDKGKETVAAIECDVKNGSTGVIPNIEGEAHSGRTAVVYTAKGQGWLGFGWNWTNWKPTIAPTDISGYDKLSLWVRVTGSAQPGQLMVFLTSSDSKTSVRVDAIKYCPNVMAGAWHEVVIPMKDLLGEGSALDVKKVWELQVGCWAQEAVDFKVYVDDIGFTGTAAVKATTKPTEEPTK